MKKINATEEDKKFAGWLEEQAKIKYENHGKAGCKHKTPKYRPFTHKVYGTCRGEPVAQAFKNSKAAEKFASTLKNPLIILMQ